MTDHISDPPGSKRDRPAAGLYLVATPIGNLGDITLRALHYLRFADVIACEDTRVTRKLLSALSIPAGRRLKSLHDHSTEKVVTAFRDMIAAGQSVVLVSDAGSPLVSDPGHALVRLCQNAGLAITAVPGASALVAALQLSGLPAEPFTFYGFLPNKPAARRRAIESMRDLPHTLVFFETPHRLAACLADLAAGLGARQAVVARELTKRFEEVRRDSLAALAEAFAVAQEIRGELVVLVGPPAERAAEAQIGDAAIDSLLRTAPPDMSVKDRAAMAAEALGLPRRRVYQRALQLDLRPQNRGESGG